MFLNLNGELRILPPFLITKTYEFIKQRVKTDKIAHFSILILIFAAFFGF